MRVAADEVVHRDVHARHGEPDGLGPPLRVEGRALRVGQDPAATVVAGGLPALQGRPAAVLQLLGRAVAVVGAALLQEPGGHLRVPLHGSRSDLAAIRTTSERRGDYYILNGQKTFISNGIISDVVIVVAKTDPALRHKGISLLVVERDMEGFKRGRKLDKVGLKAQDTAELSFEDVKVPVTNLLGEEGKGFSYLMRQLAQERLSVGVSAVAACETALEITLEYCKERTAFGQPIGSFQNSRFKLAEMKTEIEIARVFVDRCIDELNDGNLTQETAAMAKWWTSDLQKRVVDQCVQLHGGYGYMLEYPIARAYLDARVQSIYAGTNEIMKEIIGRSMGI